MMTSLDVVHFYNKSECLGIKIWIDGGWGVDALLGRQTRPHEDLDIAIESKDLPKLRELLEPCGYKDLNKGNATEWNFVLGDDEGRQIDVHAFVLDAQGKVAGGIMYPLGSLTGVGTIDGQTVRCISPGFMVKFHTGYKLRDTDFKDVPALCEKFGIDYPEEYAHLKRS
jgi:lincosamide nucleotidyltransferase A/C/D/E